MVSSYFVLLILSQLAEQVAGLQVTPNSACAKLCLDDPTTDISDPNSSSTNGSDIVCTDSAYASTSVGQKFNSCLSCLQNSTANSTSENDQEWFLYNIQYSFSTCLFNSKIAAEAFSTPCSISSVCGPLASALQSNLDGPAVGTQYSYCGANNETFNTNSFSACSNCLRQSSEQTFLANQLIALDAGCIQRPTPGVLLGLDGSIFSSSRLNITSPVIVTPSKKKGLTTGAIGGIAAAGVVGVVIILAFFFVCYRKRLHRRNSMLRSSLDPRFGNKEISNPIIGGYSTYDQLGWHSPNAFEAVDLPKVPPPTKTSALHDNFKPPPRYEGYYVPSPVPPPPSQPSSSPKYQNEGTAHSVKSSSGTNLSPPATKSQAVPMLFHSPGIQPYTPSEFSFMPSRDSMPSTPVTPISPDLIRTTHLDRISTGTALDNRFSIMTTSTNFSEFDAPPGLPSMPKRSPSLAMQNTSSAARKFSKRGTTDLSFSRGDVNYENGTAISPGQISGPLVSVGSRYEDEEEDAKRRRERLYKEGFTSKKQEAQKRSRNYDSEEELW